MKQYYTCDGCDLIYPVDQMNILDGKEILCDDCMQLTIEEILEENAEEDEEYCPHRPLK